MSRLSDLYKAMETLRKEGLPVTDDLEIKANELEEDIIKKEILPMLSRTMIVMTAVSVIIMIFNSKIIPL